MLHVWDGIPNKFPGDSLAGGPVTIPETCWVRLISWDRDGKKSIKMPSTDHHHLRCTYKETEAERFQASNFTFPEGGWAGFKQKQSDEKTCVLHHQAGGCSDRRRPQQKGTRGARQAVIMEVLKSQTKELNLKPWTLGSHHKFLRESVLWDWSGGKTFIVYAIQWIVLLKVFFLFPNYIKVDFIPYFI